MNETRVAIIIPARYGSTRFPGKPLEKIAGKSMLQRVYDIACKVSAKEKRISVYITTDDTRIKEHANSFSAETIMTPKDCISGTCRVFKACEKIKAKPDIVVNLQGDVPLLPPEFLHAIIHALESDTSIDVATPVTQLNWNQLHHLRAQKKTNPFSGTTVILNQQNDALWFSKNIIPAIRNEQHAQKENTLSPVFRHIGLYAYRFNALQKFIELHEGRYEKLEGLEQLRLLENGMAIKAIPVTYGNRPSMSGVDTPEDLKLAEDLLFNSNDVINA